MKKIIFFILFVFLINFSFSIIEVYKKNDKEYFLYDIENERYTIKEIATERDALVGTTKNSHYNFGGDKSSSFLEDLRYLTHNKCILTFYPNSNFFKANWNEENSKNIFRFLKNQNTQLSKEILEKNLMMKVRFNYRVRAQLA